MPRLLHMTMFFVTDAALKSSLFTSKKANIKFLLPCNDVTPPTPLCDQNVYW